jgi:hypothetical protein
LRNALGDQWRPEMEIALATAYLNRGVLHGKTNQQDIAFQDSLSARDLAEPVVAAYPQLPDARDTLERAEQNLDLARRLAASDAGE